MRMVKRCMEELELDPKRFPPRVDQGGDLGGQEPARRRRATTREAAGHRLRGARRRRLRALREADARGERDGLRRPAGPHRQPARAVRRGPRALPPRPSAACSSTSTRTPTAPSTGCCSCSTEEHRNLIVVGDDDQSIYGFRGADIRNILDFEHDFPDADDRQARAELPLDADDPRRRQRADRPQPRPASRSTSGPTRGARRAGGGRRARRRARRGALGRREIERLVDERASPRDEIAVFYRTNAQSRVLEDTLVRFEIPYQVIGGTKFYERAEIKDAIAYLSLLANPADAVSFARIVNSPRRGIGQHDPGAAALAREHASATTSGRCSRTPERVPGLGRRGGEGGRPLRRDDGRAARARRAPRPGRRAARGGAARDRLPRGARGRAHDRGRGADREPRGAGRRRRRVRRQPRARGRAARWRRWRSSSPRSRSTPSRTRCATTESLVHADDAPQRQGPRVRGGVHDRLRGGRLPALALARGGQPRGGAAALLRRRHPGARAALR